MSDRVERLKGNHFSLCQSKMERNIEINIETISTGFFFYQDLYALFSCLKLVENYVCTFLYFEDVDKLRYKDMDQTRECSRAQL